MAFSLYQLRFIDSLQFLNSSLDKLSSNLSLDDLKVTAAHSRKLDLLRRKGVYPCEYKDGYNRLEEGQVPPKEAFYSKLTREQISDVDYQQAQRVYR